MRCDWQKNVILGNDDSISCAMDVTCTDFSSLKRLHDQCLVEHRVGDRGSIQDARED